MTTFKKIEKIGLKEKTVSKIKVDGVIEMNIEIKSNSTKFNKRMTIEEIDKEIHKVDRAILRFDAKCDWNFVKDFMLFIENKSKQKGKC